MRRIIPYAWLGVLLPCLVLVGCGEAPGGPQGPPPKPEVDVAIPRVEQVTDYEDFPGQIEAIEKVDVRARVTGYLESAKFREGEHVKKGDVLFEIDPRPYVAELERAKGSVVQAEGRLKRLEADFQRSSNLLAQRNTSREEYDKIAGDRTEAMGSLDVAKAARDLADLNVGYTKVKAPLSGRISRRSVDPGNLVKADDTILTMIVTLDPVYAYFDLDERTALWLQRLIREKKIEWSLEKGLPVHLGLADEQGFPRTGKIDFADNHVDTDTGTWRLRARFDNADRALVPGSYVRIRLPIGTPYRAVLIAEQALGSDQGQKFVYVIDSEDKIEYRPVKIGRQHHGLRAISDGLTEKDQVVVSGLQRIRPDVEVTVHRLAEMPSLSAPGEKNGSGGKKQSEKKK